MLVVQTVLVVQDLPRYSLQCRTCFWTHWYLYPTRFHRSCILEPYGVGYRRLWQDSRDFLSNMYGKPIGDKQMSISTQSDIYAKSDLTWDVKYSSIVTIIACPWDSLFFNSLYNIRTTPVLCPLSGTPSFPNIPAPNTMRGIFPSLLGSTVDLWKCFSFGSDSSSLVMVERIADSGWLGILSKDLQSVIH